MGVGRVEPDRVKVAPWVALRELLDGDRFCSEVEDRDGVRKSWKHIALRGETFSQLGSEEGRYRLRSAARPEGSGDPRVMEDNLLAERCAALAEPLQLGDPSELPCVEAQAPPAAGKAEGGERGDGRPGCPGRVAQPNLDPDERRMGPGGMCRPWEPRGADPRKWRARWPEPGPYRGEPALGRGMGSVDRQAREADIGPCRARVPHSEAD